MQRKKFRRFYKKIVDFLNFTKYKTFKCKCPTQNLVPVGTAVLTFIGYKQTDKQAKFIYT